MTARGFDCAGQQGIEKAGMQGYGQHRIEKDGTGEEGCGRSVMERNVMQRKGMAGQDGCEM